MQLHNKIEIIKNGKTIVQYNTMLPPVLENIKNLKCYNNYFVFGTGTSESAESDYKLSGSVNSFASTVESANYNYYLGPIFVCKKVEFNETLNSGAFSFSEVGIGEAESEEELPCRVINRFLIKDENGQVVTITKAEGEEMVVKITIYLACSFNTQKPMVPLNTDSSLFARILGIDNIGGKEKDGEVKFYFGRNYAPNSQVLGYDELDLLMCPFTLSKTSSILNNKVRTIFEDMDQETRVLKEGLIAFNGHIEFRLNMKELAGEAEDLYYLSALADRFGRINLYTEGIEEPIEVTTQTSTYTAETVKFGLNFDSKIDLLFGSGFNFSEKDVYVSTGGGLMLINGDNALKAFKISGSVVTEINTEQLNLAGAKCVGLTDDYLFVNLCNNDVWSVCAYKIDENNAFYKLTTASNVSNISFSENWGNFVVTNNSDGSGILVGLISGGYGYVLKMVESGGTITASLVNKTEGPFLECICATPFAKTEANFLFILEDTLTASYFNGTDFSVININGLSGILNEEIYKKCGKGEKYFLLTKTDLNKKKYEIDITDGSVSVSEFSAEDLLSFSPDAEYSFVYGKSLNKQKIAYDPFMSCPLEFEQDLPKSIDLKKASGVVALNGYFLIIFNQNDGGCCLIPIKKNYYTVINAPADDFCDLSYVGVFMPGANFTVEPVVTFEVSI